MGDRGGLDPAGGADFVFRTYAAAAAQAATAALRQAMSEDSGM